MVRTRHSDVEIDLAADGAARAAVDELTRGEAGPSGSRPPTGSDTPARRWSPSSWWPHASAGATWADIGEILGVSTQAAHQKYRWVRRRRSDGDEDDVRPTPPTAPTRRRRRRASTSPTS